MGIIDRLTLAMIDFDKGDPKRIQHFLKVHRLSQLIGRMEKLDDHTLFILESAAVLHDIGIHPAEAKYGTCNGKLQEQEGPAPARQLLEQLDYDEADIARICYLIAHHHTYKDIQGADYQILVEADFLVNLYGTSSYGIGAALKNIFRTESGKKLCHQFFGAVSTH